MKNMKKGVVIFQDKMVLFMGAIYMIVTTVLCGWVLYLTALPTESSPLAVWACRIIFGMSALCLPGLIALNPDRYVVWYRFTAEGIEYHTAFRRKRELPYSFFPYVLHGKYFHGMYWRDYIILSNRRLKDAELNHINHVTPSTEHFLKIRYSEKTAEKLISVLPLHYQKAVAGIGESIRGRTAK